MDSKYRPIPINDSRYIALASPGNGPNTPSRQSRTRFSLEQIRESIRSDLRVAVVTLFSLCALLIIGSFAVYRFATGDPLTGAADALIILTFIVLTLLSWRPRWARLATNLTAVIASASALGMIALLEVSAMWVFVAVVGSFLMAERRIALISSAILVFFIVLQPGIFDGSVERLTFIAVATMLGLFSLIFSARVDTQHGKLTELAERDGLTGAYNRRSLDRDLTSLVMLHTKPSESHCLALMDVDNFKQLNDTHGHDVGDQALVALTRLIEKSTREKDRFYRYGGEEFVLLMPRTTLKGAGVALENLRQQLPEAMTGPEGDQITMSFGLAELRKGESADQWLNRADQALLQAKRAGKNQVQHSG